MIFIKYEKELQATEHCMGCEIYTLYMDEVGTLLLMFDKFIISKLK